MYHNNVLCGKSFQTLYYLNKLIFLPEINFSEITSEVYHVRWHEKETQMYVIMHSHKCFFFWQKSEIYLDWQDLELLKHLFTTGLFLYHPKTEKQSFSDVLERGQ